MDDWQTMNKAAAASGVARQTVARWVKLGLLKSKPGRVGNLVATLVSVAAVKAMAKVRKQGRPKGK